MSYLNRVLIVGNLGRAPEVRSFQNGGKVANLRVATTETWKDRTTGEKREATEWHSVAVTQEHSVRFLEQYAKKGSKILVEGKLRTRKWQDQSGQDRYSTEILVAGYDGTVRLLGGSSGGGQDYGSGGGPTGGQQNPPSTDIDDEIPF